MLHYIKTGTVAKLLNTTTLLVAKGFKPCEAEVEFGVVDFFERYVENTVISIDLERKVYVYLREYTANADEQQEITLDQIK